MKFPKFSEILVILAFMTVLWVTPVFAQDGDTIESILTIEQFAQLAFFAPAITAGLRLLIEYTVQRKLAVNVNLIKGIVFAVSGFFAWLWFPIAFPNFPAFTELRQYLTEWMNWIFSAYVLVAPVYLIATKIYDYIIAPIRNHLGGLAKIEGFATPAKVEETPKK